MLVINTGMAGVPPPPPGMFKPPQGPNLKEKKKYKLDVQMRRMNWNQVGGASYDTLKDSFFI